MLLSRGIYILKGFEVPKLIERSTFYFGFFELPDISQQEQVLKAICKISPPPTENGPKPTLETYKLLSGPMVIPVGNESDEVIISRVPDVFIRTILPDAGVGNGCPEVFWST